MQEVSRQRFMLGSFGEIAPFQGVAFSNQDAYNDFVTGVDLRGAAKRWPGMDASIFAKVNQAVIDASSDGYGSRYDLAVGFVSRAQALASQIDQLQQFGFGGRSEGQDASYKSAMTQLKALIAKFLSDFSKLSPAASATFAPSQMPPPPATTTPPFVQPQNTQATYNQQLLQQQQQAALMQQQAQAQQMQQQPRSGGIDPMLLAAGGAVALLAVIVIKKRQGGLSGMSTDNRVRTTVVKDRNWGQWVVKLYVDGKRQHDADYFTDEKDDALSTAQEMERHARRHRQ